MKKRVVIINVMEGNVPSGDEPCMTSILLETDRSNETIESAIAMIDDIKSSVDFDDEPVYGFEPPEDWESLGWDEKVEAVFDFLVKKYSLGTVLPAFEFDTTAS